ncbi:54S ribosomal protein-like protein [Hapsidospora chrysogenum ATCC 11550]|uniref:54S ribosomal protein-like protein n=1 Tax=Hapsidospora chrysogenum (strain ATCC 11550 / CBS 779.69 / DSM 880 / IAM 14645 / JCM 23072 / IMI 49137) TaxID=857340 RepID=A0A086T4N7_HAPC1|nr:54S ribosomal protein-like protein [Hapsidospora chrysogenum ATCC 11550]
MPSFTPLRAVSLTASASTTSRSCAPIVPRILCQRLTQRQQQQQTQQPSTARTFTTTPRLQTKTIQPARLPRHIIPPYPYGERRVYKQSNKGLYGNVRIRFGNNVSEAHGVKTQRFWRPNVHVKVYYSESLGAKVKTRLTMRVLKSIKREGGLENYLLKDKPARVKELGPGGWNLRWLLMQTRAVQERFNEERVALGLEPKPVEDRDDIVQYALDHATPGKLSVRSRETLAELRMQEVFTLGPEELDDVEGVEELTPEMEEELLKAMGENDLEFPDAVNEGQVKVKAERDGVRA